MADYYLELDTRLVEGQPTTNYGSETTDVVGRTGTKDTNDIQAILRCDISAVGAGSGVASAYLKLYIASRQGSPENETWTLYRCKRNTVEGEATWNIYSTGNNWGTAGALDSANDYDSGDSVAFAGPDSGDESSYFSIDVTDFVKDILDNHSGDFNVVIHSVEVNSTSFTWNSKDNASNKPYIEVTAGTPATVSAVTATATAAALLPTVKYGCSISATVANAPAAALPPRPTGLFWRLWFGDSGAPGKIQVDTVTQLLASEGADKATQTMAAGENRAHGSGWAADVGRAYFSTRTNPYKLIRVDPDNLSSYTVYTASGRGKADALCITGGKVYVASDYGGFAIVDQFNTGDATPSPGSQMLFSNAYGANAETIATDGTFLYVGTNNRYVLKIRISDKEIVAAHQLADYGRDTVHAIAYDPEFDYLFCTAAASAPGALYRLDASDLGNETYQGIADGPTDDIAVVPGYIYVGPEGGMHGYVCKIPKQDMTSWANLAVGPVDTSCYGVFAEPSGEYVWAVWAKTLGEVSRIKVSDNTHQRIWLSTDENTANDLVFCGGIGKILVTCWLNLPFKIVRLTNLIVDDPCRRTDTSTRRSYWHPIRLYAENTPGGTIDSLEIYSDGASGLGTGVDLKGETATTYVEPTGTPGTGGDELNTTSYSTLAGAPADVFGWTVGSPKSITGSETSAGDIGHWVVIQLSFDDTASDGVTPTETLTLGHDEGGTGATTTTAIYGVLNVRLPPRAMSVAYALPPVITISETITAVAAAADATCPLPSVAISETIAAVVATAGAATPLPSVHISETISATVATASAAAPLPTIKYGCTITAVTATAGATVPASSVAISETIAAVVATAGATVPASSVHISETITAVVASAGAAALNISFHGGVTVTAVPTYATAVVRIPSTQSLQEALIPAEAAAAVAAILESTISSQQVPVISAVTATAGAAALLPTVTTAEAITAEVATASAGAPSPTLRAGVTITAVPCHASATVPSPVVVITGGVITISTVVATADAEAPLPTITSELLGVTITAVAATAPATALSPSTVMGVTITTAVCAATAEALVVVITAGVTYSQFGTIVAAIDPDDYPDGAEFYLVTVMWAASAVWPVRARLYNVTDSAAVTDSLTETAATAATEVISPALSLPSGEKTYRVEIGGVSGQTYYCSKAEVRVVV